MVAPDVIEALRRFSAALEQADIRPHRLILYGSHAAGHPQPDSDMDVAVVSPLFAADRFAARGSLFRIAGVVDPRLEPIPVSEQTLRDELWIPIIWEISAKGIALENLVRAA